MLVARVEPLRVGRLNLPTDMIAADLKDLKIDGILGQDVINQYDTTFDLSRGELIFDADEDFKSKDVCYPNEALNIGSDGKPMDQGFVVVDLTLPNGKKASSIVDTGSPSTILNWPAAKTMGLAAEDARVKRKPKGTEGLQPGISTPTWLYRASGLKLGSWAMKPMEIRISDLPVFEGFGLQAKPGAILGFYALNQRRFTITRQAKSLCLSKPGPA